MLAQIHLPHSTPADIMTARVPKIKNGTIFIGNYSNFTRTLANRAPKDFIFKRNEERKQKFK